MKIRNKKTKERRKEIRNEMYLRRSLSRITFHLFLSALSSFWFLRFWDLVSCISFPIAKGFIMKWNLIQLTYEISDPYEMLFTRDNRIIKRSCNLTHAQHSITPSLSGSLFPGIIIFHKEYIIVHHLSAYFHR